jgi:hypothetical protein
MRYRGLANGLPLDERATQEAKERAAKLVRCDPGRYIIVDEVLWVLVPDRRIFERAFLWVYEGEGAQPI